MHFPCNLLRTLDLVGEVCPFILRLHGLVLRVQVVTYVVTRPGRELLFTVVTQEEKYKAKVSRCFCSNEFYVSLIELGC